MVAARPARSKWAIKLPAAESAKYFTTARRHHGRARRGRLRVWREKNGGLILPASPFIIKRNQIDEPANCPGEVLETMETQCTAIRE
jgi:hypothetical protein